MPNAGVAGNVVASNGQAVTFTLAPPPKFTVNFAMAGFLEYNGINDQNMAGAGLEGRGSRHHRRYAVPGYARGELAGDRDSRLSPALGRRDLRRRQRRAGRRLLLAERRRGRRLRLHEDQRTSISTTRSGASASRRPGASETRTSGSGALATTAAVVRRTVHLVRSRSMARAHLSALRRASRIPLVLVSQRRHHLLEPQHRRVFDRPYAVRDRRRRSVLSSTRRILGKRHMKRSRSSVIAWSIFAGSSLLFAPAAYGQAPAAPVAPGGACSLRRGTALARRSARAADALTLRRPPLRRRPRPRPPSPQSPRLRRWPLLRRSRRRPHPHPLPLPLRSPPRPPPRL